MWSEPPCLSLLIFPPASPAHLRAMYPWAGTMKTAYAPASLYLRWKFNPERINEFILIKCLEQYLVQCKHPILAAIVTISSHGII